MVLWLFETTTKIRTAFAAELPAKLVARIMKTIILALLVCVLQKIIAKTDNFSNIHVKKFVSPFIKNRLPLEQWTTSTILSPNSLLLLSETMVPTLLPTTAPTETSTDHPSVSPTLAPTEFPTLSISPSESPTLSPTLMPSTPPTVQPSNAPTVAPTVQPSCSPTVFPSETPSEFPSSVPSGVPTMASNLTGYVYVQYYPGVNCEGPKTFISGEILITTYISIGSLILHSSQVPPPVLVSLGTYLAILFA